jgi:pyrophosphatase PpaX
MGAGDICYNSMLDSVDAILFDLDGTIVNTIPLIFTCYEHTLGIHAPGYTPSRELLVHNLGRSLNDILYDYAVASGASDPKALMDEMLETYRTFQRANVERLIQPFEGMREALEALRERGVVMGLVTSKVEWAARQCYDFYGLGEFLSVLVFHDDTARHKPDPEPLLLAATKGGLDPARTAYVGDSVQDMAAARAAGMRPIAALWGPSTREDLAAAGAEALAETPMDLVRIVRP